MTCHDPELMATVVVSVPVDRGGVPFWLDRLSENDVEFYSCATCGEQFNPWEEANAHYLGEEYIEED